jgi:hypothetical protein
MADHGHSSSSSSTPVVMGIEAHRATYEGFLSWSAMIALISLYVCVALVDFRFVDAPLSLFAGFGGIILGVVTTHISLRMRGNWLLPIGFLVLYGLFIGANVHNS